MQFHRLLYSSRGWHIRLLVLLLPIGALLAMTPFQGTMLNLNAHAQSQDTPPQAVIHAGIVFIDYNRNGVHELGEIGLPNIAVRLETLDGVLLGETTSDDEGYYMVTELPAETFRIRVVAPPAYHVTVNGEYVIITTEPRATVLDSTGLFTGVYLPIIDRN